jgi:dUTP pyrophosphatase
MGQTISSSFVWKRDPQELSESGDIDAVTACDADASDLVALPIELEDGCAMKPERKTLGAAGFDLFASKKSTLQPTGEWTKVHTGLRIGIGAPSVKQRLGPDTVVYGAIRGRSGLTYKGIEAFHGTIDSDYTGEIVVLMKNTTAEPFEVSKGDRVAQLIFLISLVPNLVPTDSIDDIVKTERGENGFGSTGVGSEQDPEVVTKIDVR